jgi:hypothetical protein
VAGRLFPASVQRPPAIVNFHRKSEPFRRVEDLLAIKGISERKLEELRRYVTVVAPPQKPQ